MYIFFLEILVDKYFKQLPKIYHIQIDVFALFNFLFDQIFQSLHTISLVSYIILN